MYQHEDFREVVRDEYRNVFAPYIEYEMMKQIDYYAELLQPSLNLNFLRFEEMYQNEVEVDTETYDEEVETLKQFILARKETLDLMWAEEEEICIVRFEGTKEKNRCIAVRKGDALQLVLNEWEMTMRTISG